MPMNRNRYPPDWDNIALIIKQTANWTCQSCGKPCRQPGERDDELIERIESKHPAWAADLREWKINADGGRVEIPKLGRFTLTTAHLNHIPSDCRHGNLRALCSVCHCRMDLKAMPVKKQLKREWHGQLRLIP
jgi:hypothetical protein